MRAFASSIDRSRLALSSRLPHHTSNMNRFLGILALALLLPVVRTSAGGGPLNTLVVVNSTSRDSRALGAYYIAQHGIPPSHLCTIKTDPRAPSISRHFFEREIQVPIQAHIANHKLEGQIHYLVLCMDIPSRVDNFNGLTAAVYYGFKPPTPDAPRCHIASNSVNQYFGAEMAYTSSAGWNQTNAPIPFLLTAENLKTAKKVVDRAVASQASFPAGIFCLYGSSDSARNIRYRTYSTVARQFALFDRQEWISTRPAADPVPELPVLGYMTGRPSLPTQYVDMVLAPGAIAEHLTSCAGMIPDPCLNQSTVWDWMRLGATASYGTVSEPCAFREKFPDPNLFFWYARGFTAGEALAMSVRNPYQGLWVGDPLAAPFAAPPSVEFRAPARQAKVTGEIVLKLSVSAHELGAPPVFLDLYLDGRHHAPVARPFAPVGNELIARVGTNRYAYTVAPGEDLFAAVAGLAWAVNANGAGQITASAKADRLDITVRHPVDGNDQPLEFSVAAELGFGKALYIDGFAGMSRLLVEDGVGRAAALFHLGTTRTYNIEYPLDLSQLTPGPHTLTAVVRDGTAVQCQSQADLPFIVEAAK